MAIFEARLAWVRQKSNVQECLQAIERRKQYFTMVLSSSNSEYIQEVYSEVMTLSQRSTFELQKILATWLGAPDYHAQHAIYLTSRRPGTGYRFIDGPLASFLRGSASSIKILWLQGKSGCGKSFIASHAIERTTKKMRQESSAVLYFQCTFKDTSTHSASAVIASLIHQMCEKQPDLWDLVHTVNQEPILESKDSRQRASLDQLKRLFLEVSIRYSKLYVFLDAPNESSDCAAIITTLCEAIQSHPFMRLCVSSTPELSIQPFERLSVRYTCVKKDAEQPKEEQKKDFRTCIENFLLNGSSLVTLPSDLKSHIIEELSTKADGSFRWVGCQLQSLADKDTIVDVRRALKSLPPSLYKTYRDTLVKVPLKERVRVRQLLRWLSVQIRPMKITELSEAVVIVGKWSRSVLTDEERLMDKGRKMKSYLKSVGSLVSYDPEAQTVTLAHTSVKEFLLSPSWQDDKDLQDLAVGNYERALKAVLAVCLWYILQEPFRGNVLGSNSLQKHLWPLYDYCAQAWPHYVEELSAKGSDLDGWHMARFRRLFESAKTQDGGSYRIWLQQYAPKYVPKQGQAWTILPPLHLAAGRGWLSLVQLILATDRKDIDAIEGENGLTPILRAAVYCHIRIVHCLINAGADPAPQAVRQNIDSHFKRMPSHIRQLIIATSWSKWRAANPATAAPNEAELSSLSLAPLPGSRISTNPSVATSNLNLSNQTSSKSRTHSPAS